MNFTDGLLERPLTTLIPILAWLSNLRRIKPHDPKMDELTMPTATVLRGGMVVKGFQIRTDIRVPLWRKVLRLPKTFATWIWSWI